MSKSCNHNLPSSCLNTSEIIDDVNNKIESCIQEYMNLEETVTYLQKKTQDSSPFWDQLQRDSPEFFKNYQLKLKMTRHIKMFNGLLAKQVALMIESGEVDISSNPSSYPEVNPSSLALADETNGPTVNQLQIPNNQQNQVQHYHWSTSNVFTDNYLGAPTYAPAFDQLFTSNGLPYNYPAASTVAPATTAQWSPSNNPAYIGVPTVAQATTMPQDPFTFGFGGNIGYNGQSFTVPDLAQLVIPSENQLNGQYLPPLQLQNFSQSDQPTLQYEVSNNGIQYGGNNIGVMQPENQLQDLYGHYLPQLQLQNFPQEGQQTLQYEVSNNGIQHGGNNIGVMQSENQLQDLYGQYQPQLELQQPLLLEELQPLQYGVSNSELQYGGNTNLLQNGESNNGLQRVIPESNNPNSGDGTLTMPQVQHDLQVQQGRGGL